MNRLSRPPAEEPSRQPDNPILAEYAAEIRRIGKRTFAAVVETGRLLKECRAILKKEGDWRDFLHRELKLPPQSAGRFIQVYELTQRRSNLEHLDLPVSAFYLLAAPSTPEEATTEIIERAEAGDQVTTAEVKTAIAKRKPEPKPKRKYDVNPAAAALFANEDQLHAFAGVMRTMGARRFITFEQQVDLAKQLTEGNIRAASYQPWVSDWLRQAGKLQGRIDAAEKDDLYKQFPGYEIRDEVAAVKSAARELVAPLLKLEQLFKKFPHNPFFGDLGDTLDQVINMVRQYRRAAGEDSSDKVERKLAKLAELERKTGEQKSTIAALRSEVEELREKLEAKGTGGEMSVSEFQAAIKMWEDLAETQKTIIAQRDSEIASLRAGIAAAPTGEPQTMTQLFNRAVDVLALLDGALSEGPDRWPKKVSAKSRNQQINEVHSFLARLRGFRDVIELHSGESEEEQS